MVQGHEIHDLDVGSNGCGDGGGEFGEVGASEGDVWGGGEEEGRRRDDG